MAQTCARSSAEPTYSRHESADQLEAWLSRDMADSNMTLEDRFLRSQGQALTVGGQTVAVFVDLDALDICALHISLHASSRFVQGLCISASGVTTDIAGEHGSEFVLWSDTAPSEIRIDLKPSSRRTSNPRIRFWNAWRLGSSTVSAHGNFGVVADRGPGALRLRCSDGDGPADFTNLVADIRWS